MKKALFIIGEILLPVALLVALSWWLIPAKQDVVTGEVIFNPAQGVWGLQVKQDLLPDKIFQINNLPTEFQQAGINLTCNYQELDVMGATGDWDVVIDVSNCLNNNTGKTVLVESPGTMRVARFSGKLNRVDSSCLQKGEGECFAEVGGKHITILIGGSTEPVGYLEGVSYFEDFEKQIDKKAEVYAQDKGDGTYTLYGSEQFYIKLN